MDTSTSLTTIEQHALARCEQAIEHGLKTFVEVGLALAEIREKRLYRQQCGTFEEYCRERWSITRMRASQMIAAAETVENVNHGLQIISPTNERQTRPLTCLEPEQQRQAWQQAVETAPTNKDGAPIITGDHVKRVVREYIRETVIAEKTAILPPARTDRYTLICDDFVNVLPTLPPDSVDVILTDPPYGQEYLPLYADLAHEGRRVLKPGGSLIVMVGQSYLPEIMALMAQHLTYNWTAAYLTPGGQSPQIWQRRVNTFWKPVLWFVKGTYAGKWVGDVAQSDTNDNDKRFHSWGQSESGMTDLIERFTDPGDLILDPFLGGGTTGVVAVALDRRFIGIDKDQNAVDQSTIRIAEVCHECV